MSSERDDFIWAVWIMDTSGIPTHDLATWFQRHSPYDICEAALVFSWRDPRRQRLRRGLRWATSVTTEEVEQAIKEARQ